MAAHAGLPVLDTGVLAEPRALRLAGSREQLLAMTRENRWDRMREIIDDEMLDAFIPSGTYADIPRRAGAALRGLSGYITLMMPEDPALDAQLAEVVATLRGGRARGGG